MLKVEVFLVTKWNGMSQVLNHIDILDDCCPDRKGLMWWVIQIGFYI